MVELGAQDGQDWLHVVKMDEVGPKTVQSRTKMAQDKPKLGTSWPQDCMRADISQTFIKLTKSNGKTMIFMFPIPKLGSNLG